MPVTTANYIDPSLNYFIHSENGLLGQGGYPTPGQEDPELINAGKETVTIVPGGAFISSCNAFSMIRGDHLDMTMLGAF